MKNGAEGDRKKGHFVYGVRTGKGRQNVAMLSLSWELGELPGSDTVGFLVA